MKISPSLPLLLLALTGVLPSCTLFGGLSAEQQKRVDLFKENAESYLLNKRIPQAENQIQKGLELDPGDYYLNLYKGWVELLQAPAKAEYYIAAADTLQKVVQMRSQSENDYRAYLFLGQAQMGLSESYRKEASFLGRKLSNMDLKPRARAELQDKVAANQKKAVQSLKAAEGTFKTLLATGDSNLQAQRYLLLVETQMVVPLKGAARKKQIQLAIHYGLGFLKEAERRRKIYLDQAWRALNSKIEGLSRTKRFYFEDLVKETNSLLASLYERDGQIDQAIAHLTQNIKLDPRNPGDRFTRGRLLARQGKAGEARQDLNLFLSLTRLPFHSPEVTQANAILRKLH